MSKETGSTLASERVLSCSGNETGNAKPEITPANKVTRLVEYLMTYSSMVPRLPSTLQGLMKELHRLDFLLPLQGTLLSLLARPYDSIPGKLLIICETIVEVANKLTSLSPSKVLKIVMLILRTFACCRTYSSINQLAFLGKDEVRFKRPSHSALDLEIHFLYDDQNRNDSNTKYRTSSVTYKLALSRSLFYLNTPFPAFPSLLSGVKRYPPSTPTVLDSQYLYQTHARPPRGYLFRITPMIRSTRRFIFCFLELWNIFHIICLIQGI